MKEYYGPKEDKAIITDSLTSMKIPTQHYKLTSNRILHVFYLFIDYCQFEGKKHFSGVMG